MKTYVALAMSFLAGTAFFIEAAGREGSSYARVVFHVQ